MLFFSIFKSQKMLREIHYILACLRFCHSKCYCERLFEPIKNSFTKRVNEAGKTNRFSVDSDDEEYGIKKLFETAASDVEDVEDVEDVMTMRTSTLTMLFCITIIVAVHAGNGKIRFDCLHGLNLINMLI